MRSAWTTRPLWAVVSEVRRVVDPSILGESVYHYSIPVVDSTGDGAVEPTSEIRSAKLELRGNEALVSKLNPRKSRVVLVADSDLPIVCSTEFVALVPHDVDRRFLTYVLSSEVVRQQLDARVQSVTRSHQRARPEDVTRLKIGMPPMEEQSRIADFLDVETSRIEAVSELRRRQAMLVRERTRAALDELLIVNGNTPHSPLMNLVDPRRPIQYGIVLPGPDYPDGVPIIKGGDIAGDRLTLATLARTDPAIDAQYSRSRVRGGDLVIAIRGSVGEVARVPASLTGANLTQDSARIAPSGVDSTWLWAVLQTQTVQHQIAARITGATISGINIRDLRRVPVPVPDLSDQRRIGGQAAQIFDRSIQGVRAIERSIGLLSEHRQSLVTAAVTGQLDVTTADRATAVLG